MAASRSGNVVVGGALTYGGVTLSNSVTGTGSMVLSASPALTGTVTAPGPLLVGGGSSQTVPGAAQIQCTASISAGIWAVAGSGYEAAMGVYEKTAGSVGAYLYSQDGYAGVATINNAGAYTGEVMRLAPTLVTLPVAINYGGVTLNNSVTGTGSMVLSASPTFTGNVGIGNTAPNAALHVTAPTTIASSLTWGGAAGQILRNENSELAIGLLNAHPFPLWIQGRHSSSGARDIVFQASGGNVGIGTSSPGAKLDIKGLARSSIGTGTGAGGAGYAFYQFGISATASENWHIGSEGDGSFRFYNQGLGAGIERLRLDSSGRLGIGTSSPDYLLTLQSGDAAISMKDTGGTTRAYIGIAGISGGPTGALRLRSDQGGIVFSYLGSETMRIDSSGNVGIGTSSPGAKLDISAQNALRVTGFQPYQDWRDSNDSNKGYRLQTAGGNLLFAIDASGGGTYTERMRIDSSGRVGIGTSSPGTKLDVAAASDAAIARIRSTDGTRCDLRFESTGSNSGLYFGNGTTFDIGRLFYDNAGNNMVFATNSAERMRINSSGRVGIGTSSPDNAKLNVDGDGPSISTSFAYFALSGSTAITGYIASQNISYSIWTSGRISSAEFNARSDGRLKKDVMPIPATDAWQFIKNVAPVYYKWINGPDDGHKFGFIAQDVMKAGFSNLVGQYGDTNIQEVTDADGFTSPAGVTLTVNYDQIVPILASALRDALSQIDDLKARLTALEAK